MEEKKLWYVVNAYSGHEQKVKDYLESRRESMGMENNIFRVVIPEQTEIEVKDGPRGSSFTLTQMVGVGVGRVILVI